MPHAWLLHLWLIAGLLLMPVGKLAHADEDIFTLTGTESRVDVSLTASDGTTGLTSGTSRLIVVNVQLSTWEVWTGSVSGMAEIRNLQSGPLADAALTFGIEGDGDLQIGASTTNGNGDA